MKVLVFVNFIFLLINIPTHVFPTLDVRFGFPSQQLLYPHPTYLGTIAFLGWDLITDSQDKYYKGMAFLLMLSTMRTKLILIAVAYILYNFFNYQMKIPISQKVIGVASSLSIIYYFFSDTIYNKMLSQESSARFLIMSTAVKIAKDHFPFGSGFASYGSNTSFTYYSPIYVLYGLSRTYGFLTNSYQYGTDSYISMVLAQFGFFGCLLYIAMFALIIFNMLNDAADIKARKSMELLAFYLILSFFTESIISSGTGIAILGFISLNTHTSRQKSHMLNNDFD
ncbi:O-antigen ligase family protein [Enterococcus faecium]|uniref:O-antigen ligase family protein n=1 Tax=Enterococcus faecium TaxID=1352 RepID=UPI001E43D710|nr:O-antigen ligase family protein [Enterococcus faecium]